MLIVFCEREFLMSAKQACGCECVVLAASFVEPCGEHEAR